jgi:hypothetical protein
VTKEWHQEDCGCGLRAIDPGRHLADVLCHREAVLAHLRERAEKATNHSSQLEDLREEVLRLVRAEGDES